MVSSFGRVALALDLMPLGVSKWDLAGPLQTPGSLEDCSRERLGALLDSLPATSGRHLSASDWDLAFQRADVELTALQSMGASIVTVFDAPRAYPGRLHECYRSPLVLEVLGDASVLLRDAVAVVGSRKATAEGIRTASDLAGQLSRAGLVIVSGLAYGIDKAAHMGCLEAGGATIAVLGSGIDTVYPSAHESVARRIVETGGAVISEFHLGTQPAPYTFPQRNRIISGLSLGVIVVEAAKDSGSLLTANFALEQNREVFAVPGSIYAANHVGTNALIKSGAKLVQDVNDILTELPGFGPSSGPAIAAPLTEREGVVLRAIREGRTSVDLLCQHLQWSTADVLAVITRLEVAGVLLRSGPDTFTATESGTDDL
ncbi:MAG TPA: DNA-processing protein DprA [Candidatus Cryosericum sp.]